MGKRETEEKTKQVGKKRKKKKGENRAEDKRGEGGRDEKKVVQSLKTLYFGEQYSILEIIARVDMTNLSLFVQKN